MKKLILCGVLAGLAAIQSPAAEQLQWLTDVRAAQAKAKLEKKLVMLDFTGSDWCGWCIKLKSEVFDTPVFAAYAKSNLVLVEVDFPKHKNLNPIQQAANTILLERYHVDGFPTIVVIDSTGEPVGETGYIPGGPNAFIAELNKTTGSKNKSIGSVDFPGGTGPASHGAAPAVAAPVVNAYESLALKGISGTPTRRFALINDQTLMVGEKAKVKVQDQRIEVVCNEIRDDSVLVTVNGKSQELKLGKK